MTKTRLHLLRECRSLTASGSIQSFKKSAGIRQSEHMEYARPDDQVHSVLPSPADSSNEMSLQEITSFSVSSVGVSHDNFNSLKEKVFGPLQSSLQGESVSSSPDPEMHLPESDNAMGPSNRCQGVTTGECVISIAGQTPCSPPEASQSSSRSTKASTDSNPTAGTMVPTRMQSYRSSIPSLMSLGRRLSMKYSESTLGDVISIMRNLSVSSSTSGKGTHKLGRWRKRKKTTLRTCYHASLPSMKPQLWI